MICVDSKVEMMFVVENQIDSMAASEIFHTFDSIELEQQNQPHKQQLGSMKLAS